MKSSAKKKSIVVMVSIILCGIFCLLFALSANGAADSLPSQNVKGRVIAFQGKNITISLPEGAQVAQGDKVTVSFMAGDDPIPYGEWQVSSINSNGSVEATPVGNVEQPTINLDAYIKTTGKTAAPKKNEPQKQMTADERFELAVKLLEGDGQEKNIQKAVELVKQGVAEGHPASIRGYGWAYEEGKMGFSQDYKEASKWYQKAADAGDNNAAWLLGKMYADGRGVSRDFARAKELLTEACEKGQGSACNDLAWRYYSGEITQKDLQTARQWYNKGCELNHMLSCGILGYLYAEGLGGETDKERGLELLQNACDKGNKWSCDTITKIK